LFCGSGAGGPGIPAMRNLAEQRGWKVTLVKEIPWSLIKDFDVILFPGGTASKQRFAIGEQGAKLVRQFVNCGGGYFGVCAGAYLGGGNPRVGLGLLEVKQNKKLWKHEPDIYGDVELKLGDNSTSKVVASGAPFPCMYRNGPLFSRYCLPKQIEVVAVIVKGTGSNKVAKKMVGLATIVRGKCGKGSVVLCGPHPEQTKGLQDFTWELISSVVPQTQIINQE